MLKNLLSGLAVKNEQTKGVESYFYDLIAYASVGVSISDAKFIRGVYLNKSLNMI